MGLQQPAVNRTPNILWVHYQMLLLISYLALFLSVKIAGEFLMVQQWAPDQRISFVRVSQMNGTPNVQCVVNNAKSLLGIVASKFHSWEIEIIPEEADFLRSVQNILKVREIFRFVRLQNIGIFQYWDCANWLARNG